MAECRRYSDSRQEQTAYASKSEGKTVLVQSVGRHDGTRRAVRACPRVLRRRAAANRQCAAGFRTCFRSSQLISSSVGGRGYTDVTEKERNHHCRLLRSWNDRGADPLRADDVWNEMRAATLRCSRKWAGAIPERWMKRV